MPPLVIFIDASTLVAAAGSPSGGSSAVLTVLARGTFIAALSMPVIDEARRSVQKKMRPAAELRLRLLLRAVPFAFVSVPADVQTLFPGINPKDAHVYAAAAACRAAYIVTLDRGFLSEVNAQPDGPRAVTPGEFLTTVLPSLGELHEHGNGHRRSRQ